MRDTEPSLIRRWAHERQISPPGGVAADRLSLTIDRVRVHLVALRADETLVEARVADLPRQPTDRNRMLERVMPMATGRMIECPASLVVDAEASTLKLQLRVSSSASTDALDQAVTSVVNEVELWRGLL